MTDIERLVITRKDPWELAIIHREECHAIRHQVDRSPRPPEQPSWEKRQAPAQLLRYDPTYITIDQLADERRYRACRRVRTRHP